MLFLHKYWPAVLDKVTAYIVIKICHCIAIKIYFVLLWQRVNFTQKPISPLLCAGFDDDIKNNAWVTENNVFLVTSEVIWHEWRSHEWKSLANHPTRDQNIVIHGNECIILFLTCYFISWAHSFAKNNHWSFISSPSPRKVFSALALWRHHNWSVTSREREILALWCHIRQLFLHAQIGAKAIFTSE